jgi:hypothetical protein
LGLSENREKVLGNEIANREKVSGLSENRKKFWVSLRIEKEYLVMK